MIRRGRRGAAVAIAALAAAAACSDINDTDGIIALAVATATDRALEVGETAALAAWVLKDHSEWTRARVDAAMAAPVSESVRLSRPIRVVLFYLTALVDYDDGAIHFADDIYGHDARLERALAYRQLIAAGTRMHRWVASLIGLSRI